MKTLKVSISELEYNKFGIKNDQLTFSELIDLVNKEILKMKLSKSIEFATKYNLSNLSMDEITAEVKKTRKNV